MNRITLLACAFTLGNSLAATGWGVEFDEFYSDVIADVPTFGVCDDEPGNAMISGVAVWPTTIPGFIAATATKFGGYLYVYALQDSIQGLSAHAVDSLGIEALFAEIWPRTNPNYEPSSEVIYQDTGKLQWAYSNINDFTGQYSDLDVAYFLAACPEPGCDTIPTVSLDQHDVFRECATRYYGRLFGDTTSTSPVLVRQHAPLPNQKYLRYRLDGRKAPRSPLGEQ